MKTNVDLSSGWDTLWGAIEGAAPELWTALTVIGVIMILVAAGKWAFDKYRDRPGKSQGVIWALVLGAVLAGPALLIPLVLTIFEVIINLVFSLVDTVF